MQRDADNNPEKASAIVADNEEGETNEVSRVYGDYEVLKAIGKKLDISKG